MDIVKSGICALALVIGWAAPAYAATIDFAQGHNPQDGPLNFTNGSESVSVDAARLDGSGGTALIASYAGSTGGLGVYTSNYNAASTGGVIQRSFFWGLEIPI